MNDASCVVFVLRLKWSMHIWGLGFLIVLNSRFTEKQLWGVKTPPGGQQGFYSQLHCHLLNSTEAHELSANNLWLQNYHFNSNPLWWFTPHQFSDTISRLWTFTLEEAGVISVSVEVQGCKICSNAFQWHLIKIVWRLIKTQSLQQFKTKEFLIIFHTTSFNLVHQLQSYELLFNFLIY